MQRFEDVFGKYIEKKCDSQALRQSDVAGLQIATEDNAVRITLSSAALISHAAIAEAQRSIAMGLLARVVEIKVHYPAELLGEEAFLLIIDYLKAANVPVNGFFRRAVITYENERFTVKLPEGIAAFLEPLALPGKIAAQADELFGVRPQVSFVPVPDYELKPVEEPAPVMEAALEVPPPRRRLPHGRKPQFHRPKRNRPLRRRRLQSPVRRRRKKRISPMMRPPKSRWGTTGRSRERLFPSGPWDWTAALRSFGGIYSRWIAVIHGIKTTLSCPSPSPITPAPST